MDTIIVMVVKNSICSVIISPRKWTLNGQLLSDLQKSGTFHIFWLISNSNHHTSAASIRFGSVQILTFNEYQPMLELL